MTVPDAKRLKDLELENSRLKKLLAESLLDIGALKVVTRGKGEPGSGAGGGGRRCRRKPTSPSVVPVSCSGCPALCCATSRELVCKTPSCKPNWWNWQGLRHFGYHLLHILLRRAGVQINYKRIYRLYRAIGLMVKRRRRRHRGAVACECLSLPSAPN